MAYPVSGGRHRKRRSQGSVCALFRTTTGSMAGHRTTRIGFFGTGVLAVASGACSLIYSTSKDQCATDDDCHARGAGFEALICSESVCVTPPGPASDAAVDALIADAADTDGPFSCALLPPPIPDPNRPLDVLMRFTDFTAGAPVTNANVRLCGVADPACGKPRELVGSGPGDAGDEAGAGWVMPTDAGHVTAKVEYGFDGFFEVLSPQYAPTYRFTAPPLRAPATTFDQLVFTTPEVRYIAELTFGQGALSPEHGLVFVFARDCFQNPVGGASFRTTALDPLLKPFVIINSTPSADEANSDGAGRGGFLNVPEGIHTFIAFYENGTKKLGSARAFVRKGSVTTVGIAPSP